MKARILAAWSLAAAAACTSSPRDPFVVAERALQARDLAAALQALDAVEVAHPNYPQARAHALAVENNLRRCHELMLQAMRFRAEWRDREALAAIEKACSIWPDLPGARALAAATSHRLQILSADVHDARRTAMPRAVVAPPPPAAPAAEVSLKTAPPPAASPGDPNDDIAARLVAIERRLAGGQFDAAVADLLDLDRLHPSDVRVRSRLARFLHQRALLRYGDGRVELAIADWRRVLELDPEHRAARSALLAAELERR